MPAKLNVSTYLKKLSVLMATLVLLCSSCAPDSKPPYRDFSTSDLLITSLPGWQLDDGPSVQSASFFNIPNTIMGSTVQFVRPIGATEGQPSSSISQWVIQLPSKEEAARAYEDHYFVHDSDGLSPTRWLPVNGFTYNSSIANLFRVVCDYGMPDARATTCAIEAQYDEFFSLIFYSTSENRNISSDLETIATALDTKMMKYIGSQR
jgi:hypothetical protein